MTDHPKIDVASLKVRELSWKPDFIVNDRFNYNTEAEMNLSITENKGTVTSTFKAACEGHSDSPFLILIGTIEFVASELSKDLTDKEWSILNLALDQSSKELIMGQARHYLISLLGASGYSSQVILPPVIVNTPLQHQKPENVVMKRFTETLARHKARRKCDNCSRVAKTEDVYGEHYCLDCLAAIGY